MALKGLTEDGSVGASALDFWSNVSATFGANDLVMYELYNEPHIDSYDTWSAGDDTYAGMLEMYAAVRANAPEAVVVIAGQKQCVEWRCVSLSFSLSLLARPGAHTATWPTSRDFSTPRAVEKTGRRRLLARARVAVNGTCAERNLPPPPSGATKKEA